MVIRGFSVQKENYIYTMYYLYYIVTYTIYSVGRKQTNKQTYKTTHTKKNSFLREVVLHCEKDNTNLY